MSENLEKVKAKNQYNWGQSLPGRGNHKSKDPEERAIVSGTQRGRDEAWGQITQDLRGHGEDLAFYSKCDEKVSREFGAGK